MITWHYITRDAYDTIDESLKTSDKLYFIKDENKIYCNNDLFKEFIILYNINPSTYMTNRVYININTLEGKIWDGSNWITIINPVRKIGNEYLSSSEVLYIEYNNQYNYLVVTKIDGTEDIIELEDLVLDIVYSDGEFMIQKESCYLSSGKRFQISDFIDGIIYDGNGTLNIVFNGDSNNILSIYTEDILDSDTVSFSITGNNFIAECYEYSNYGNIAVCTNDIHTIYRVDLDYSIALMNEDSDNTSSSSDIVDDTISNMISVLADTSDTSNTMTTVGFNHVEEILVADSEGNAKASGKTIVDKFCKTPDDNHIPTEKAVRDYLGDNIIQLSDITPYDKFKRLEPDKSSDNKLASERCLIEQMSWEII